MAWMIFDIIGIMFKYIGLSVFLSCLLFYIMNIIAVLPKPVRAAEIARIRPTPCCASAVRSTATRVWKSLKPVTVPAWLFAGSQDRMTWSRIARAVVGTLPAHMGTSQKTENKAR